MFVSGVVVTGKSFLIETIRSLVKEMWKDDAGDDTTCAVATPTGLAAYNVGGMTVHRADWARRKDGGLLVTI